MDQKQIAKAKSERIQIETADKFEIIDDYFDKHTLKRHSATFIVPISSFEVLGEIMKEDNAD
ncbi:MAG: hypothetical protein ACKO96_40295 [Flammeovirgaceae bacterium]